MKKNLLIGILLGILFGSIKLFNIDPLFNKKMDLKNLKLESLDSLNRIVKIGSSNEKKLLYFWGSYCAPCIKKLPKLNSFIKQNPDYELWCISTEAKNKTMDFLKQNRYSHISFYSTQKKLSDLSIYGIPKMVLIKNNKAKLLSNEEINSLITE